MIKSPVVLIAFISADDHRHRQTVITLRSRPLDSLLQRPIQGDSQKGPPTCRLQRPPVLTLGDPRWWKRAHQR